MYSRPRNVLTVSIAAALVTLPAWLPQASQYTRSFPITSCTFATTGKTPYWVLEPGYTLELQGKDTHLIITVLDKTETVGGIATRVVEERETEKGALVEVSRNYFAICKENSSVFYFGEDVDIYKNGKITGHEGAWRHGTGGATAGLMMPGIALLGARYHQEVAPGVAMDRAEITGVGETLQTPYGAIQGVVVTRESSPLEPGATEIKAYAPGIGIVRDADLLLVSMKRR
jgi:hypothetical protein